MVSPTSLSSDSRIEAACYFLASPDSADNQNAEEFERCIQELVDMIEAFQKPDGYVGIYFSVVDTEGRFRNFRDMHEMCESDSFGPDLTFRQLGTLVGGRSGSLPIHWLATIPRCHDPQH